MMRIGRRERAVTATNLGARIDTARAAVRGLPPDLRTSASFAVEGACSMIQDGIDALADAERSVAAAALEAANATDGPPDGAIRVSAADLIGQGEREQTMRVDLPRAL